MPITPRAARDVKPLARSIRATRITYPCSVNLLNPLPPLRPLDIKRITHQGREFFMLRDPLKLAGEDALLVPVELGPLLVLLDGTRTAAGIARELPARYGVTLDAA